MYLLGIVLALFFVLIELMKKRITPLLIFSAVWLVILSLSSLHLYGLDKANDQAYMLIAIGLFSFGVGEMLSDKLFFQTPSEKYCYLIREKFVFLLAISAIILFLTDFLKVINYLINGQSLAYIRILSQDSSSILYEGRSALERAFRIFIIQPFVLSFQVLVAKEFWHNKKKWLILDIIIILLKIFSEGSRSLVLYLGIHLIVMFFFNVNRINMIKNNKDKYIDTKIVKKRKRILRYLIAVIVVIILYTTVLRSGDRVFRSTYYYFSMQPVMLGIWMNKVEFFGFGTACLNGLVYPVLFFFKNLLNFPNYPEYWYKNVFSLIDNTDKLWQIIASFDNTKANAYVSIFWFPFLDGGYVGEVIIMFVFGIISRQLYKNACRYDNDKYICLYAYLLQAILFSFVRFQFADISYAVGFMFLWLFAFKRKRRTIYE